jgi:hypothetical protein
LIILTIFQEVAMKRIIVSALTALSILCLSIPVTAKAATPEIANTTSYTEYYDDGSYSVITITEYEQSAISSVTSTKPGSKSYTHYVSGEAVWSYTINASFSYNGSSSSCTSVSDSYSISNSSWHIDSHSCSRSGNTAYGSVTMKKKVLGITTDTVSRSLSLSCSASGTLS